MRALVALTLVLVSAPALATPGAVVVPPIAADLGAGSPLTTAPSGTTTELRIGASWASLYWRPTALDIVIGYIGSYRTLAPDDTLARSLDVNDAELRLHGLYFELAYAIENHTHWRTWIGARVESLGGDYHERSLAVVGGALRLGAELYSTGAFGAGDNRTAAFFAGAFAVGVYVEGTARTLPAELGPVGVGAGVSVRVPFIAAIGT